MDAPPTAEAGFGTSFWQWVKRPRWSVAAPVLLLAFAGVFVWQIFLSTSEVDQGLTELNAAYRAARPLEARLAGFSYAPYAKGVVKLNDNKLKLAADLLSAQAEKLKTPVALSALGKFHLAQRQFEAAIQQFETALKSDANSTQLQNDLGVALMEKAWLESNGNKSADFTASRTHLEQAIKLDRNALEPLFNLALLQQRQGWWEQAEESWKTYLKNDVRSSWAEEAKRYLSEIEAKKKQPSKG